MGQGGAGQVFWVWHLASLESEINPRRAYPAGQSGRALPQSKTLSRVPVASGWSAPDLGKEVKPRNTRNTRTGRNPDRKVHFFLVRVFCVFRGLNRPQSETRYLVSYIWVGLVLRLLRFFAANTSASGWLDVSAADPADRTPRHPVYGAGKPRSHTPSARSRI